MADRWGKDIQNENGMEKKIEKNAKFYLTFSKYVLYYLYQFTKGNPVYDESGSSVVPFFLFSIIIQEYDRDLTAGSFSGIWHLPNPPENGWWGLFALEGLCLFLLHMNKKFQMNLCCQVDVAFMSVVCPRAYRRRRSFFFEGAGENVQKVVVKPPMEFTAGLADLSCIWSAVKFFSKKSAFFLKKTWKINDSTPYIIEGCFSEGFFRHGNE